MTPGVWLPLDCAAAKLGLAVWTLRSWRYRVGVGLPVSDAARELVGLMRSFGRSIRINEADLQTWIDNRRTA